MGLHIEFGEPGVEEYLKEVMDWNERYIEMAALANELEQQNHTLLAALRSVEWTNAVDGGSVCAWCGGRKYDGHAPDCQRQAAIAAVEGE